MQLLCIRAQTTKSLVRVYEFRKLHLSSQTANLEVVRLPQTIIEEIKSKKIQEENLKTSWQKPILRKQLKHQEATENTENKGR